MKETVTIVFGVYDPEGDGMVLRVCSNEESAKRWVKIYQEEQKNMRNPDFIHIFSQTWRIED